ncbi:hypothetical protein [Wohlfahrtiimonas populi]|uniref:hypothetical protein n=1 Tax=Wohlfahrtiimonas populi TaxID=1940240 RepID=UPI0011807AD9|nr:hypothetical protein [Wohlfahrtiimonas populi]
MENLTVKKNTNEIIVKYLDQTLKYFVVPTSWLCLLYIFILSVNNKYYNELNIPLKVLEYSLYDQLFDAGKFLISAYLILGLILFSSSYIIYRVITLWYAKLKTTSNIYIYIITCSFLPFIIFFPKENETIDYIYIIESLGLTFFLAILFKLADLAQKQPIISITTFIKNLKIADFVNVSSKIDKRKIKDNDTNIVIKDPVLSALIRFYLITTVIAILALISLKTGQVLAMQSVESTRNSILTQNQKYKDNLVEVNIDNKNVEAYFMGCGSNKCIGLQLLSEKNGNQDIKKIKTHVFDIDKYTKIYTPEQ